jgi:hypothetical protein
MSKHFTLNGIHYDEEALPKPEANAMMINYINGQWELNGWGGVIENDGTEVCDWELLARADTFDKIVEIAKIYAEGIGEG